MKLDALKIKNYKSIRELEIRQMENACILVGRNSTGKTVILDAIQTALGQREVCAGYFNENGLNIEITVRLSVSEEDLRLIHARGLVSRFKRWELFYQDFCAKFPSFEPQEGAYAGVLTYTFIANKNGKCRYADISRKDNPFLPKILPKIYYIDHRRDVDEIEDDIIQTGIREQTTALLRENRCMFDASRQCNGCYLCVGKIEQKPASELTVLETEKLLEYKLLHADSDAFMQRLNCYFQRNSGQKDELLRHIHLDASSMVHIDVMRKGVRGQACETTLKMSEGMKSIYILSLLEAYMEEQQKLPCLILMEDPELFLHPQLQKTAGEVLYRLSRKNQIIFSTHSPTMLYNFNKKQIKQVQLDGDGYPVVREENDIGQILDDLGFSANDLMNVGFVFIVEGKQDKSRLPLLLNRYYSEMYDENGRLQRIAIIVTNSCTNIKTYANLKYMNQVYLKDQFLMIRDGDGKNPEKLRDGLCAYYEQRRAEDVGAIPRVTPKNVLILKYYSFENYFLDPKVMAKIGVIRSEEEFYETLYEKYTEYLFRIRSFVYMREKLGLEIHSQEDIRDNLETILIYGRGHNLFDIFYGRYKGEEETEILTRYIAAADRDNFRDILDAIDAFVYFDSRKKS